MTDWDLSNETVGEKAERRADFKRMLAKTLRLIGYIIKNSDENLTMQAIVEKIYLTAGKRATKVTRYAYNVIVESVID